MADRFPSIEDIDAGKSNPKAASGDRSDRHAPGNDASPPISFFEDASSGKPS